MRRENLLEGTFRTTPPKPSEGPNCVEKKHWKKHFRRRHPPQNGQNALRKNNSRNISEDATPTCRRAKMRRYGGADTSKRIYWPTPRYHWSPYRGVVSTCLHYFRVHRGTAAPVTAATRSPRSRARDIVMGGLRRGKRAGGTAFFSSPTVM